MLPTIILTNLNDHAIDRNSRTWTTLPRSGKSKNVKISRTEECGQGKIPRKRWFLLFELGDRDGRRDGRPRDSLSGPVLDQIPGIAHVSPPSPRTWLRSAIFIRLVKSANGHRNIVSWRPLERCPAGRRY